MTRVPVRPAVVAVTVLLLLVAGGLHVALAGDLPFETIAIGATSGFVQNCSASLLDGEAEYVITNRVAWEQFWRLDGGSSIPLPYVNFGQESVVAVVLGCFGTSGGPRIEITGIEEIERETRVHVLSDPRPGAGLGISTPFHIVKVRRIKGPVSFFHKRLPEWFCNAEFP